MSNVYYKIVMIIICLLSYGITEATPNIAKPGCKSSCGNTSIPYPFGIGPKCYHDSWFDVECIDHNRFGLKALNNSVLSDNPDYVHPVGRRINWFNERTLIMESVGGVGYCAGTANSKSSRDPVSATDLRRSPFLYSSNQNVLLVVGCGGDVRLKNSSNEAIAGCAQVCEDESEQFKIKNCYGLGCCQTALPNSIDFFWLDIFINPADNTSQAEKSCVRPTVAMLVDKSWISDKVVDLNLSHIDFVIPTVLEWTVENLDIHSPGYANSTCKHKKLVGGYDCRCKAKYYQGNPYLPYGCQVVKECEGCVQNCRWSGNNTFGCGKDNNEEDSLKQKAGLILGLGTTPGPRTRGRLNMVSVKLGAESLKTTGVSLASMPKLRPLKIASDAGVSPGSQDVLKEKDVSVPKGKSVQFDAPITGESKKRKLAEVFGLEFSEADIANLPLNKGRRYIDIFKEVATPKLIEICVESLVQRSAHAAFQTLESISALGCLIQQDRAEVAGLQDEVAGLEATCSSLRKELSQERKATLAVRNKAKGAEALAEKLKLESSELQLKVKEMEDQQTSREHDLVLYYTLCTKIHMMRATEEERKD